MTIMEDMGLESALQIGCDCLIGGCGVSAGYVGVAVIVHTGDVSVLDPDLGMSGVMGCVYGWRCKCFG